MKSTIEQLATNVEFGSEFRSSPDFWEKTNEIIQILEIPYITTKEMQRVGYGLTDFYISWLRMTRSLGRITNSATNENLNLAERLVEAMRDRESALLDTPTMLTAMFLDPRLKYRLNATQAELATMSIEKLYLRISNMENRGQVIIDRNDTLDELNAEALVDSANRTFPNREPNIILRPLHESLAKFEAVKPINIKFNVFDFWRERKEEFPLLYKLATIVHSVQAGQCAVERDFSAFACARDSRRCKQRPKNLSNILMIRLNPEVYKEWKSSQILGIQEKGRVKNHFGILEWM